MKKLVFLLIVLAVGCAVAPITGRKQLLVIPADQMLSLSAQSYSEVLKTTKTSTNQQYINQVRSVGVKLTAAVEKFMQQQGKSEALQGYQWQYNVLQSKEANAWCMPGGQIAFYEGIMPICQDENGIAVVMGHEIAHAVAQHGNERMSQQLALQLGGMALSEALSKKSETTQQIALAAFGAGSQLGVMLPYSRTHEYEADELGLYFMAMAGFDPRTAPSFWERMIAEAGGSRPPEFLSTHPDPANRIQALKRKMNKAMQYYQGKK
jgi:predicted Zn-dependent protease